MSIEFSPIVESDIIGIRALMRTAFQVQSDAPFLNVDLLRWKYIEPRPDWEGSRGFVFRQGDKILAHCGLAPVRFMMPGNEISAVCFMDWAASSSIPGIGGLLLRRLMKMGDIAVVAGGTADTWAAIPKLGFVRHADLLHYVRVVRPWNIFQEKSSEPSWKRIARLLRYTAREIISPNTVPAGWELKPITRFEAEPWQNMPSERYVAIRRDAELLNYWLRCPLAKFSGFLVLHNGRVCGHVLINKLRKQARIVDVRLNREDPAAWQAAYALATRQAMSTPEIVEVRAIASAPLAQFALNKNGFHKSYQASIFLYDPRKILDSQPLHWNFIDDDSALI
jgi:hypothetical protein